MERENTFGKMENLLMAIIRWIKNKDTEYFIGQMGNNTKDIGVKENKMVVVKWFMLMVE